MKFTLLLIGLALALVSAAQAQTLSPNPVPAAVDAMVGSGFNLTADNTLYQQGLVTSDVNSGVPPNDTIFTNINNSNMTFQMPTSYTMNDDLMIVDSSEYGTNTSGTLTFNTPVTTTSLEILDTGGNGGAAVSYTVTHTDNSTDTGTLTVPDWFAGGPVAWGCNGRIDINGNLNNLSSGPNNQPPYLYASTITVSSGTPITSITFNYNSGSGIDNFFAVSAETDGSTYTPVPVTGFNVMSLVPAPSHWISLPTTSAPLYQPLPLTVAIPPGANSSSAFTVTINDSNTNIATLPGSVNGNLTLNFAAGATNAQVIPIQAVGVGTNIYTLTSSSTNINVSISLIVTPLNILENPNWTPTTVNGPDGGRDWTYTTGPDNTSGNDQAAQFNDIYGVGFPPVGNGSLGLLGASVSGTNGTPDFEYAASAWSTASPGQTWTGGAYFQAEYGHIYGDQEGIAVVVFADANLNILSEATNVAINASSPDQYTFGAATNTAPAGTAFVQLRVGACDPAGNGGQEEQLWIAQASLTSSDIAPVWVDRFSQGSVPGQIPITITIPDGMNLNNAVSVTLSNGSPNILSLPGETGSTLTLNFAAGANNVQTLNANDVSNGLDIFYVSGANFSGDSITVSDVTLTNTLARLLFAQYAPGLIAKVDGTGAGWSNLISSKFYMDTSAIVNSNVVGNLGVDTRYAWDNTYLYILVAEDTNHVTAAFEDDYDTEAEYLNAFYQQDAIAFWIDLSNTRGETVNGTLISKPNADYQPWFGFSSFGESLYYGRANDSANEDISTLTNATILTAGDFSAHNRTIEVAIAWTNIAADVSSTVPTAGDVAVNPAAGKKFGSDPLLLYGGTEQTFVGGQNLPSGVDTNSVDVELMAGNAAPIALNASIQSGQLVITWPAGISATLQSSLVLGAGESWSNVAVTPTVVGYNNEVTLPLSAAKDFYRLEATSIVTAPGSQ